MYADIAHAIGGDKVNVTAIIHSPSQDPHSYQATTQDKLTVTKARLLVENGGGYDNFFTTLAGDSTGGHQLLDVTKLSGPSQASSASRVGCELLGRSRAKIVGGDDESVQTERVHRVQDQARQGGDAGLLDL